jgi:hypothetical protein
MKKILLLLAVLVVGVMVWWYWSMPVTGPDTVETTQPTEEPLDVTLEFYNAWLSAVASTTVDPITAGVLELPMVTTDVRNQIVEAYAARGAEDPDPVLCQLEIPERVGAKPLYTLDTTAEFMILARGFEERSPLQAVVTLAVVDGAWLITNIRCVAGDTAPEREYDFDSEGFLLKSVQPPLDPNFWHLVYEQNGQLGYTVPLFFSTNSECVAADGTVTVCAPDTFTETTKVRLQADMTESGAQVRRITF